MQTKDIEPGVLYAKQDSKNYGSPDLVVALGPIRVVQAARTYNYHDKDFVPGFYLVKSGGVVPVLECVDRDLLAAVGDHVTGAADGPSPVGREVFEYADALRIRLERGDKVDVNAKAEREKLPRGWVFRTVTPAKITGTYSDIHLVRLAQDKVRQAKERERSELVERSFARLDVVRKQLAARLLPDVVGGIDTYQPKEDPEVGVKLSLLEALLGDVETVDMLRRRIAGAHRELNTIRLLDSEDEIRTPVMEAQKHLTGKRDQGPAKS